MNLFTRAFLAGLVVLSGTAFAGCKSCRGKKNAPAAAAMKRKKSVYGPVARKGYSEGARKRIHSAKFMALMWSTKHAGKKGSCKNGSCKIKNKRAALAQHIAMKAAKHKAKKGSCKNGSCKIKNKRVGLAQHIAMKAAKHKAKKGSCANGSCSR